VTTGALENLDTIVLFNCVENGTVTCKRTYGYVKTDTKSYRIGADGKNEEVVRGPADTTSGVLNPANFKLNVSGVSKLLEGYLDSDVFKLNVENGFEFVDSGYIDSVYLVELADNGIYLSTEDYNTAIAASKTHIAINAVRNAFVFDNTYESMNLKIIYYII